MDKDHVNLNDATHDKREWWEAKKAEHEARLEKMNAEERMEANKMWDSLNEEFEAATEWTDAAWDEFTAKVSQWWNAGETKVDESI